MNVLQQPSPPELRTASSEQQRLPSSRESNSSVRQVRLNRRRAPIRARTSPSSELQAAAAAAQQADVDYLSTPQRASASSNGSKATHLDAVSSSNGAHAPELCSPEDLVLEPGELSHIDRNCPLDSDDVFRCSGCLQEACQVRSKIRSQSFTVMNQPYGRAMSYPYLSVVCWLSQGPSGCAKMLWRDQPGGYLKEILTARVYDVAVSYPAQLAILLPCVSMVTV